ncbi:MAG: hypothetical protein L6461_03555 [Anaerolineae bacterium]|nr:hypothetical protein [Anaerolineae bacterium]
MNPLFITATIAIAVDAYLVYLFARYWRNRFQESSPAHRALNFPSLYRSLLPKISKGILSVQNWRPPKNAINSNSIELTMIAFWAVIVGFPYLDFDPFTIPSGIEFGAYIQFQHLWTRFLDCGWCAVWNSSTAGGVPAFTDIFGSALHPIVALTTLLFGVVNGAKLSLIIAFWIAGIAQWWLAYELKLGSIARLWSAGIAVAAGHITGRMEVGSFGMTFSMALISLTFASILSIYNGKGQRFIVLLGIIGASAILAGQGYFQAGLIGIMPALFFLLINRNGTINKIWKDYAIAFLLACLLAAQLLVPFLHFSPNFQKGTSMEFDVAQPLEYIPLNLVIDDWNFYTTGGILGKEPYPSLFLNYIGWIPVLLAILGWAKLKQKAPSIAAYMTASIILSYLIASAVILRWLVNFFPFLANIRFTPVIAGLSVPFFLAFSAYGLQHLVSSTEWPFLQYKIENLSISTKWILVIPLVASLWSVYAFSRYSINTHVLEGDMTKILSALQTDSAQWVNPPYGDQRFVELAISTGLKISPGVMTWEWRNREPPRPVLEARFGEDPDPEYQIISNIDGIGIYQKPDEFYAAVTDKNGTVTPCAARGKGGLIQVNCESEVDGTLVVKENHYSGWQVHLDEKQAQLLKNGYWLSAKAPAGKHIFVFQYLPWDVPLGLALLAIGMILCVRIWHTDSKAREQYPIQETTYPQ